MALSRNMIIGLVVLGVIVLLGALFGTLAATGVLSGQGSTTTCTDSDDKCAEWASSGECDNNPDYMLTNCCASCDDEDTTTAVEDATTAAEDATTAAEDATTAAEDATTAAEDATTAADLLAAETVAEEAATAAAAAADAAETAAEEATKAINSVSDLIATTGATATDLLAAETAADEAATAAAAAADAAEKAAEAAKLTVSVSTTQEAIDAATIAEDDARTAADNARTAADNAAAAADDAAAAAAALGCTNSTATNYDSSATRDDGSCTYVEGCMNSSADNYNVNATRDDGTCYVEGCMNSAADNYKVNATRDDGSCIIPGCTNSSADNYNVDATTDDGTCIIPGCTRLGAQNYNVDATTDDGSCTFLNTTNNMLELPAKPFNLWWVYEYLKNTDTLDEDTGVQIGKYDGTTSVVSRDVFGNYVRELVGGCVGSPICGGSSTLASLGNGSDLNAIKTRINECWYNFEDDTKCGNLVNDQTYRIINTYEPTTMDEAKDMVKYFIDNGVEYDDLGVDIGSGEDVGAIFGNFIRNIRGNELEDAGGVASIADSLYNLGNTVGNNNSSQWNELLTTVRDS